MTIQDTDAHEWRMAALNDLRRRDALARAPDCRDPDQFEPEPKENDDD